MRCENEFCIYQSGDACILTTISLNTFGACDECICVSVDASILDAEKQKLLERYRKEEEEYERRGL